jgi:Holliday junction resolvase RusA-like endonuclease
MPKAAITIESEHVPPGVNSLYANVPGKGRVRTDRYKQWQNAAGWDYNGHGEVKGEFEVSITINPKKVRVRSDLDGRAKAAIDALVSHKIVEDDHLCRKITLQYGECKGLKVEVWPFFRPL